MPNVFLNTAVAESLDEVAERLEKKLRAKQDATAAALALAGELYTEAEAVVFNGDGYTEEWVKDAKKRGLPNLRDTPAALAVYADAGAKGLLASRKVFLEHEIEARYHIQLEIFVRTVEIEAAVMARMVDTGVLPAASKQQEALARSVSAAQAAGVKAPAQSKAFADYAALIETAIGKRTALDAAIAKSKKAHGDVPAQARSICDDVRPAMAALRAACDAIEARTDAALWPYPTYHQLLFQ
jgi:glutamine synthetase